MEDLPFHCSHCLSTWGLGPQKPLSGASSKVCTGLAERCQNQPSTIREGKPDKVSFGVSAGKTQGLPWPFRGGSRNQTSGKESTCQCRRPGFDPWAKKIPCRRKWQLTPVFLTGKFHGQRSLVGYSPLGHKSRTQLSNKGKPMSMVGEHDSSPPVAKSSSKQISYEDWGTCKKVSPRCTPAELQELQAFLVPPIELSMVRSILSVWERWVSFHSSHRIMGTERGLLACGDMNSNNGAAPGPEMAHGPE